MIIVTEIMLVAEDVGPRMDKILAAIECYSDWISEGHMTKALGREVGAKRVRKILRRGDIVRFSRLTRTGKRRYFWLRRLQEWA